MTPRHRSTSPVVAVVLIALLAAGGIAAATYILLHQRLAPPLTASYDIHVELLSADGVAPGLGQPVTVAGVKVGSITGARLRAGRALVTLRIERRRLPDVRRGATASLEPITPLGDMQITLDPGGAPAPVLPAGATIGAGSTNAPIGFDRLLASLDADTRAYVSSLATALGVGTRGRGADLRAALATMWPTTRQVRRIAAAFAERRHDTRALVSDLATLTRAAGDDRRLGTLVTQLAQTLETLGSNDEALRAALRELPGTLSRSRRTLASTARFADELRPTARALTPVLDRTPATLTALTRLADAATPIIRRQIRPATRALTPMLDRVHPPLRTLRAALPETTSLLRTSNHFLNTYAYNPKADGGADFGGGMWGLPWFGHNLNSATSAGDAHGSFLRVGIMLACNQLANVVDISGVYQLLLGVRNVCQGPS
ncbi:MAG: MlaD family protein [Solirubrobacteraceae bacterium]